MSANVVVVRAQTGNVASVAKALTHVGAAVNLTDDPKVIRSAEKLVWPGQASFASLPALKQKGIVDAVLEQISTGTPYLGICLGMQSLFDTSTEAPEAEGLGVISGTVSRFSWAEKHRKVPHMGWNTATKTGNDPLLKGVDDNAHFYFVHSYFASPTDPASVALSCNYGVSFAAAVRKNNVFACQFHPEKSQKPGLQILENFTRSNG